jgi:hypothetical protein
MSCHEAYGKPYAGVADVTISGFPVVYTTFLKCQVLKARVQPPIFPIHMT